MHNRMTQIQTLNQLIILNCIRCQCQIRIAVDPLPKYTFAQAQNYNSIFPSQYLFSVCFIRRSHLQFMDLIGAESRKSGTRGGRDQFNWDNVKRGEKEFYLGNSVAGTRPRWEVERDSEPKLNGGNADGAGSAVRDANNHNRNTQKRNETSLELASVRRRERAVLNAALSGECYSEAVRAHPMHADSDSTTRAKTTADDMEIVAQSIGETNLDDIPNCNSEKAMRKEERRRRREERKIRREARQKRRELRAVRSKEAISAYVPIPIPAQPDSSESDKERHVAERSVQRPKRRRTERQTGTKRKRSEVSSSDMVR